MKNIYLVGIAFVVILGGAVFAHQYFTNEGEAYYLFQTQTAIYVGIAEDNGDTFILKEAYSLSKEKAKRCSHLLMEEICISISPS